MKKTLSIDRPRSNGFPAQRCSFEGNALNNMALATFSLADLPSGDRAKLEIRIMEHALAHWREKLKSRLSPHLSPRAKRKAANSRGR